MLLALLYSVISIYGHFACKHISVKYCENGTKPSHDLGLEQQRLSTTFTNQIDPYTGTPVSLVQSDFLDPEVT